LTSSTSYDNVVKFNQGQVADDILLCKLRFIEMQILSDLISTCAERSAG